MTCAPSDAGVVEAGWSHAAGMLYKEYQIAMNGQILDPTEVRKWGSNMVLLPLQRWMLQQLSAWGTHWLDEAHLPGPSLAGLLNSWTSSSTPPLHLRVGQPV